MNEYIQINERIVKEKLPDIIQNLSTINNILIYHSRIKIEIKEEGINNDKFIETNKFNNKINNSLENNIDNQKKINEQENDIEEEEKEEEDRDEEDNDIEDEEIEEEKEEEDEEKNEENSLEISNEMNREKILIGKIKKPASKFINSDKKLLKKSAKVNLELN